MLDPVSPLIRVLNATENDTDNPGITMEEAKWTLVDAVKLLGNASAQISRLQQRKVLKAVNPEIQDLADKDIFTTAAQLHCVHIIYNSIQPLSVVLAILQLTSGNSMTEVYLTL